VPRVPIVRWLLAVSLLVSACSPAPVATTTSAPGIRSSAIDFAVSADRALDGTAFAEIPVGAIADVIIGLCAGADLLEDAVAAAVDAVGVPESRAVDDEILTEVLTEGVRQVCPDRAGASALIAAYLSAVRDAVTSTDPGAFVDEEAVLIAGPIACDLLDRGQGPESALLAVVATLFGVEASSADDLDTQLDTAEGVIAGATLRSAVTYLCSRNEAEVAAYLAGLGP